MTEQSVTILSGRGIEDPDVEYVVMFCSDSAGSGLIMTRRAGALDWTQAARIGLSRIGAAETDAPEVQEPPC